MRQFVVMIGKWHRTMSRDMAQWGARNRLRGVMSTLRADRNPYSVADLITAIVKEMNYEAHLKARRP